jgi:hypothetical protein
MFRMLGFERGPFPKESGFRSSTVFLAIFLAIFRMNRCVGAKKNPALLMVQEDLGKHTMRKLRSNIGSIMLFVQAVSSEWLLTIF